MTMRISLLMRWGDQAWSETHYDTIAEDIPGAIGRTNTLATLRAAMLGFDAVVFGARISDPDRPGSSDLIAFNPPLFGQKFKISTGIATSFTSDSVGLANDAILVDAGAFINGRFYRSRPMLGAPPFGLIQSTNGVPIVRGDLCPDWAKAFSNFKLQMLNGFYGFRVKNEGATFAAQGITGGGGTAPIGIICSNAFSPAPQILVHVRGFRVHPSTRITLAGLWRVQATVAGPGVGQNTILLSNSETMPPGTSYLLPGSIQTAAPFISNYGQFDVDKGATRKRGGNLLLPRGRSRTRVSRAF